VQEFDAVFKVIRTVTRQHHKGHPVGHDIVHLTGQQGTFFGAGLLSEQVALPLGALGALGQRLHQTLAGTEIQRQQRPQGLDTAPHPGGDDAAEIVAVSIIAACAWLLDSILLSATAVRLSPEIR
jgi:hypothetical protein